MITSKTELANIALAKASCELINDIDGGNPSESRVKLILEETIDAVLSERYWACSIKRAALIQSENDSSEWTYKYIMPLDFGRLFTVYPESAYSRTMDALYSDEASIEILYTCNSLGMNLNHASPYVTELITTKAAAVLALAIPKDVEFSSHLFAAYERCLKTAIGKNIKDMKDVMKEYEAWDTRLQY